MKIPIGAKVYHKGKTLRPGDELDDKIAKELGVPATTKAQEKADKERVKAESEKSNKPKREKHRSSDPKPSESKHELKNESKHELKRDESKPGEQNRVEI